MNVQNSQTDTEADDVAVEETKVDEVEPSQNPSVIEDLAKEIRRARAEWENTSITERPPLTKLTVNRKAELLIKQANQAIQLEIAEETPDLNNIKLLQYVTAYVISEKLGKRPKPPKRRSNTQLQPKWKTRIENQIKGMRADLSILSDMAQKSEIQKISKKKQKIKRKYKITTNQDLQTTRESLKMKILAIAQRIRRYEKRSKQYKQNQMFSNNRKKFFRNLGKEQVPVEKPPKKEATETFWCNILANDREHNHSAEWIKREELKYIDTECQPWEDITQYELQTALMKTSNWKSPGPDAIPNVWLKQLTALHQHLLNAYHQAIEHPESLPNWFTTAQIYLLPKCKDTENPKNYRPIACLSTSYKVLTSILRERSYTHITKNNILPEEQRGCIRNFFVLTTF